MKAGRGIYDCDDVSFTSEVEENPRLVMGGYGTHEPKNLNFGEFLVFLSLVGIGFSNVAQKDPSFGKLGHVINPLTPGTFC